MTNGGNRRSREATIAARETERQVLQLYIRGLSFREIARQLNLADHKSAIKAFDRGFLRLPKADRKKLRTLEGERITDMRRRVWSELAGRPDPNDQTKTIRPEVEQVGMLLDKAVKIGRHEAALFGLDEPIKIIGGRDPGQVEGPSDEELEAQWNRLTQSEQRTYMMLVAKMEGRWVEPPSIETTATRVDEQ